MGYSYSERVKGASSRRAVVRICWQTLSRSLVGEPGQVGAILFSTHALTHVARSSPDKRARNWLGAITTCRRVEVLLHVRRSLSLALWVYLILSGSIAKRSIASLSSCSPHTIASGIPHCPAHTIPSTICHDTMIIFPLSVPLSLLHLHHARPIPHPAPAAPCQTHNAPG